MNEIYHNSNKTFCNQCDTVYNNHCIYSLNLYDDDGNCHNNSICSTCLKVLMEMIKSELEIE